AAPVRHAQGLPSQPGGSGGAVSTVAPPRRATVAVPSVEPSSTTRTWPGGRSSAAIEPSRRGSVAASSRAGTTTDTVEASGASPQAAGGAVRRCPSSHAPAASPTSTSRTAGVTRLPARARSGGPAPSWPARRQRAGSIAGGQHEAGRRRRLAPPGHDGPGPEHVVVDRLDPVEDGGVELPRRGDAAGRARRQQGDAEVGGAVQLPASGDLEAHHLAPRLVHDATAGVGPEAPQVCLGQVDAASV